MGWERGAVAFGAACSAACIAVLSVDPVRYGEGPGADASDSGGAEGQAVDAPDGGCGDGVLVPALTGGNVHDAYCIDAREVSIADYDTFLAALKGGVGDQHRACAWDKSRVPGKPVTNCALSNDAALPVSCVDWCDAWSYCAWRGKRLCGGTRTEAAPSNPGSPQSRWFMACSGNADGLHDYPYGNDYDATACNGDRARASFWPSGSAATCAGAFAGLLDMSGNAVEWEDACDPGAEDGGAGDFCRIRGGSKADPPVALRCDSNNTQRRDTQVPDLGFRCCWSS
jgi:formylglycine-generating enzyme required for sulfatase activity